MKLTQMLFAAGFEEVMFAIDKEHPQFFTLTVRKGDCWASSSVSVELWAMQPPRQSIYEHVVGSMENAIHEVKRRQKTAEAADQHHSVVANVCHWRDCGLSRSCLCHTH